MLFLQYIYVYSFKRRKKQSTTMQNYLYMKKMERLLCGQSSLRPCDGEMRIPRYRRDQLLQQAAAWQRPTRKSNEIRDNKEL